MKLFFSYAPVDERWRSRLEKHFSGLRRQNIIQIWDARKIPPGSEKKQERFAQLESASIILLLISPDYIDSEECYHEMLRALDRQKGETACVIPVLLRPIHIEDAPFHGLQSLPQNGVPITHWSRSDDALHDVAEGVRTVVLQLAHQRSTQASQQENEPPTVKEADTISIALHALPHQTHPEEQQEQMEHQQEIPTEPGVYMSRYVSARQKYLEHVSTRYSLVKLPLGPAEGFSLEAIFHPLTLRRDPATLEDHQRVMIQGALGEFSQVIAANQAIPQPIEYKEPSVVLAENSEDALKQTPQRRLIILGGPGSGKTITLKYLVSKYAHEAVHDSAVPVPIYLSLTDLARSTKTLQRYVTDMVGDMGVESHAADMLWRAIETGHAFVCLDSLDEVAAQNRTEMIELINLWAAQPGNTWIIGSRYTEYKGGQFKQGQFSEWELVPMSHPMRLQLAERLFPELRRLLPGVQVELTPSDFIQLLEHHPHAAAWGENPLLFSLAAIIALQTRGLPSSRAALYHDVMGALLQTREPDPFWHSLLMRMLTKLALWLYQYKGRTFTRSDLLTFFLEIQAHSPAETAELARRVTSSGMIEIVAHDTYAFRHQTFQEYLAAAELADALEDQQSLRAEDGWRLAWSKRTYSRWTEILRLMVGVLIQTRGKRGRDIAYRWLRALLEQRSTKEGDPGNLGLMLAVKSLAEVSEMAGWETHHTASLEQHALTRWVNELYLAEERHQTVQKENLLRLTSDIKHMRQPLPGQILQQVLENHPMSHDSEIIEALFPNLGEHLPRQILLQASQHTPIAIRAATLQILESQGGGIPLEVFLNAMIDTRILATDRGKDALEKQVGKLSEEEIRAILSGIALSFPIPKESYKIGLLRMVEKRKPRIPASLFLEALNDESDAVRVVAIGALGNYGEQIPLNVFLPLLKDNNQLVRLEALKALEHQSKHVPFSLLIAMLQDNVAQIRDMTIHMLNAREDPVPLNLILSTLARWRGLVWQSELKALGIQARNLPLEEVLVTLEPALQDWQDVAWKIAHQFSAFTNGESGERFIKVFSALRSRQILARLALVRLLDVQREHIPLEALEAALRDTSELVRADVVKILGSLGNRTPVAILEGALNDTSEMVRSKAVKALGLLGNRAPVERVKAALNDTSEIVRSEAVKALGLLGNRVPIEMLLDVFKDTSEAIKQGVKDPKERMTFELWGTHSAAMGVLLEQAQRLSVETLLDALLHSSLLFWYREREDEKIKKAFIISAEQGSVIPLEKFTTALREENEKTRVVLVKILGALGERIPIKVFLALLEDESASVRSVVFEALSQQADRIPIPLLTSMLKSTNDFAGEAAIHLLGLLGERTPIPTLLTLLQGGTLFLRRAAARALIGHGEKVPISILMNALEEEDQDIHHYILFVIRKMDPEGLVSRPPQELDQLQSHPLGLILRALVQGFAADTSGDLQHSIQFLLQALEQLLTWPEPSVSLKAIRMLGKIRRHIPDSTIQRLLELRHDEYSVIRSAADNALAEILSLETGIEDD